MDLISNYNARKHQTIGMHSVAIIPAIVDRLLTAVYNRVIAVYDEFCDRNKYTVADYDNV